MANDPIIGRGWGNYEVTQLIGSGRTGRVYRMRHAVLASLKAIKVLDCVVSPEVQQRFQQEALAASAVDSSKIVRVDDVGVWSDGVHYIIMELIVGRSLGEALHDERCLSIEATLKLLYRLADTLALVHAEGIVHRDLNPKNILLHKNNYSSPKIC